VLRLVGTPTVRTNQGHEPHGRNILLLNFAIGIANQHELLLIAIPDRNEQSPAVGKLRD
jgi:hypothetical protein